MKDAEKQRIAMISIIANGKPYQIAHASSVSLLLESFSIAVQHVVVQLDGVLIARQDFPNVLLQEGSKVEIVTLVGGG
jgi:sulfur carrier protein